MNNTPNWEKAFEAEIGSRQRPSILGGRDYYLEAVIEYRAFGLNKVRRVRVTEVDALIKNGCPGFSGQIIEEHGNSLTLGASVWGYDDQITRVIHAGDIPAPYYIEVVDMCADVTDKYGEAWMALDEGPFYSAADAFKYARFEVGVEWRVVKKLAEGVYVGIDEQATAREVTDGRW